MDMKHDTEQLDLEQALSEEEEGWHGWDIWKQSPVFVCDLDDVDEGAGLREAS